MPPVGTTFNVMAAGSCINMVCHGDRQNVLAGDAVGQELLIG